MESEPRLKNEKPEEINPELTKRFIAFIRSKSEIGTYRVEVKVGNKVFKIDVFPNVFPPKSDYSISSKSVFEAFGDLKNLEVADIGCGTGIESIVAIEAGAIHVDAVDINPTAVECSKHNIELNGLGGKVSVFRSDLFISLPRKKYDLIIANLPIVNFDAGNDPISVALYDKGFEAHRRLFVQAKEYLNPEGIITFTHANLQSGKTSNPDYDFELLDDLIEEYGYKVMEKKESEDMGYKWINYKIKLKKDGNKS
jgi:methylase of polypeptide subunit release factors